MLNVNRRGTEPFARWCERTAGVIPPPTRSQFLVTYIEVEENSEVVKKTAE